MIYLTNPHAWKGTFLSSGLGTSAHQEKRLGQKQPRTEMVSAQRVGGRRNLKTNLSTICRVLSREEIVVCSLNKKLVRLFCVGTCLSYPLSYLIRHISLSYSEPSKS